MNKSGFTLIELLVVISIVAIATVGSILAFEQTSLDTNVKELKDMYVKVQRASQVYLDINDSWRKQFNEKGVIFLRISELKNSNYVDKDLYDPVTFEEIPNDYIVVTYIDTQNNNHESVSYNYNNISTMKNTYEVVDTCLIKLNGTNHFCIANSSGDPCECCKGYYINDDTNKLGTGNNPYCVQ